LKEGNTKVEQFRGESAVGAEPGVDSEHHRGPVGTAPDNDLDRAGEPQHAGRGQRYLLHIKGLPGLDPAGS
jgi:hypothetical protein